jgi:alpha-beta hydrolase superfamily lysophospholipase
MFAMYHAPEGTPSGTAVLLVPPFGWDDQCAYRPRYDWALALAAAGHAALRVDLPGTGDSAGGPRDPDQVDGWAMGVAAAVDLLRSAGAGRVAVITMGIGGLVTLLAMNRGTAIDDLVLWGMPLKGRAALRELRAFGRLEASQTGADPASIPEGEIHAGGHVMTAETTAAVTGLDAHGLIAAPGAARALVLGRDGRGPEEELIEALRSAGSAVTIDRGQGWGGTIAEPPSTTPDATIALVNDWLSVAADGTVIGTVPGAASAVFGTAGARVRETPVLYEHAGAQLFAVIATPEDQPVGSGTVSLFNAGVLRHVGPNRMYTEAARRWAARGIPVIRLDIAGIGDAAGDPRPYIDPEVFHSRTLIEQARSSLDLAVAHGLPDRFLVGGMCSGAYWALHTMLGDSRVLRAMTLNQRTMEFDPDAEPLRELGRFVRIATPQGFRYMMMGDRRLQRLGVLILWLLKTPVRTWRRFRSPPPPGDALSTMLQTLHTRGQRLDMAFSDVEPLADALREPERLAELESTGVQLYELPYISHTLKPVEAQRAAHKFLDNIVEQTFPSTT